MLANLCAPFYLLVRSELKSILFFLVIIRENGTYLINVIYIPYIFIYVIHLNKANRINFANKTTTQTVKPQQNKCSKTITY